MEQIYDLENIGKPFVLKDSETGRKFQGILFSAFLCPSNSIFTKNDQKFQYNLLIKYKNINK